MIETPPQGTGLAEALGGIADKYLKLDVLDHSQDVSRYIGYLLDTIHSLESKLFYKHAEDLKQTSDNEVSKEPLVEEEKVPCSRILHRVSCTSSWHNHFAFTFEDEPKYQAEEQNGLCGNIPVLNTEHYVLRHPEIVFIVMKEHECGQTAQAHRDIYKWNKNLRNNNRSSERGEFMQITSTALNEAFKRIAEFEPYDRDSDGRGSWLVGEMSAPYLFFFHHYQKLHDLMQQKSSYRPILDPLIQFLDQSYAEEYRSANELFQRGLVTAYHSAKLYKPSELLVVRDKYTQTLRARVLGRVPDAVPFENKSIWKLECWSWSYNGREARRDSWAEYTDAFPTEEVPINGLQVYPLKYAKPKDIEKLRETGRRFWSMRHQGLRCYTGWDEKRDRHYVCSPMSVIVVPY